MCVCLHVFTCVGLFQTYYSDMLCCHPHLCRLDGSGALRITVTAHSSLKAVVQLQGCMAGGSKPLMATLISAGKAGGAPLERVSAVDGLPRGGVFVALPTDAMGHSTLFLHPGSLTAGVHLIVQCK